MVLFLDLWSALILGILYLFFGRFTGLAFLGIGFGQIVAVSYQPNFNKWMRTCFAARPTHSPRDPRDTARRWGSTGALPGPRFAALPASLLCRIGILLFGLTSFHDVHWIVPIIMSSFLGAGMVFSFTNTFTYLVDAYRPVAPRALASNSFMGCAFAAAFPHFGQQLYDLLVAVGGSCLLGGLMCLTIPLPLVFHRIGERVRERSDFAAS